MVDFTDRPSHIGPDGEQIPLEEHLDDVRERVGWLVPDDAETPEGNSLSELAEVVTRVHDFGKLTAWFREHLLSDDAQPTGPKHHAPISALLAHYALEARGFDGADQLVGFLAVARHHGRLPDTADYVHRASVEQSGRIQTLYRSDALEQAAHIDETVPELAEALVDRATGGAGDWETFHERLADSDAAIELRGSRKPSVAAGDFAPHRRNFLPASTSQCYRSGVRSFSPTRRARRTCRPESKSAGRPTDRRPLGG